jgi:hypothetical protein
MVALFVVLFRERLVDSITNLSTEGHQEILFLLFILMAIAVAVFTFLRNFSLIPVLGMLCCLYLMIEIPSRSWLVFFAWMGLGLAFYFLYGYHKSKLANSQP